MKRTVRLLPATLAAGLLLVAAALPAAAATRTDHRTQGTRVTSIVPPRSVMTLTRNDGETYNPYTAHSVVLTCDPAGGTHPDPATACKQLDQVDGNFKALNVNPGPWSLIYRPVTVTAKGTWRGSNVNYKATFANSCVLERQTGAVFKS
jgi:subtilisin inhibitor-like